MSPLNLEFWKRASRGLADAFAANETRLCDYDGAIGDGDHGTSMLRGFTEARESLESNPPGDVGELFGRIGETFLESVGGVTGVVFGTLFTAAGEPAAGRNAVDARDLHGMLASGLAAVVKRGGVKEGDKSMVDALAPAVTALAAAAGEDKDPATALTLAGRAAAAGMEATRGMVARVGRARYQGEKAVGHVDAGAASVALIFETLAAGALMEDPGA